MLELSLLVQVHLPIFSSGRFTASLNTGHVFALLTGRCQQQETQFIFQVPKDGGSYRGGCNGDRRTAEIQAFFAGNDASGQFYNV
jgi:hypothetical protein